MSDIASIEGHDMIHAEQSPEHSAGTLQWTQPGLDIDRSFCKLHRYVLTQFYEGLPCRQPGEGCVIKALADLSPDEKARQLDLVPFYRTVSFAHLKDSFGGSWEYVCNDSAIICNMTGKLSLMEEPGQMLAPPGHQGPYLPRDCVATGTDNIAAAQQLLVPAISGLARYFGERAEHFKETPVPGLVELLAGLKPTDPLQAIKLILIVQTFYSLMIDICGSKNLDPKDQLRLQLEYSKHLHKLIEDYRKSH